MAKKFDLSLIEGYYRIEEDGRIWSYPSERHLALRFNNCGYVYVSLNAGYYGPIGVHRLVAAKYIGVCPEGMEVSHKDGNKKNNHWSNLEYLTHSDNLRKSYEQHGRVSHWLGKKRGPLSIATRAKMSEAKKKAVVADTGEVWPSIEDCALALGTYRKAVYGAIKDNKKTKNGLRLQFVTP
jgi:hypothetical protein